MRTDATLAAASVLFNLYRRHYGEPPDADERAIGWLTGMAQSRMLTIYTASVDSAADASPIGLATVHAIPASWSWDSSGIAQPGPRSPRKGGAPTRAQIGVDESTCFLQVSTA